jgi:hypothetical protein
VNVAVVLLEVRVTMITQRSGASTTITVASPERTQRTLSLCEAVESPPITTG